MPLATGDTLGPYQILALIGEGGMGEVYRARDTRLDRIVAIKISHQQFNERFEREARAVAALNHPNVCTLHDIGPNYLVMEYVDGPTLADRMAKGPMSMEEALPIVRQIAEAVEAAHEKGIVHRDLKPANVKITPEGLVKVLDFGLAKLADPREASDPATAPTVVRGQSPTIAGMIMGTPGYMSPEQAAGQPVDRRADIWAFGVVLWEMLCGGALFSGETVTHTIADVMRAEIDMKKLPDGTPAAIRKLLSRCLDRNLRTRLQSIGEARIALERYTVEPDVLVPTRLPMQRGQASRWPWVAAIVVALLGGAGAAWRWKPTIDQPLMQFDITLPAGVKLPPPGRVPFNFSPDGDRLVFVGVAKDGKRSLWLRNLNGGTSTLPGTDGAEAPFWSPDGRFVAFFANGKLLKISISGGTPSVICEAASGGEGTWNPEGVILFGGGSLGSIQRVPAPGGNPTPVFASMVTSELQCCPFFLPDGKHFLYQTRAPARNAMLGSLDGQVRRALFPQTNSPAYFVPAQTGSRFENTGWILFINRQQLFARPFDDAKGQLTGEPALVADPVPPGSSWSARGALLAVRKDQGQQNQLLWLSRNGELFDKIGSPGDVNFPRISPNQQTIAYQHDGKIWLFDTRRKVAAPFTHEPGVHNVPAWTPDGKAIIYDSLRDGNRYAIERPSNGIGAERILQRWDGPRVAAIHSVSRDGLWEAIFDSPNVVLRSRTKGTTVPFPEPSAGSAHFSPDGRWLLYISFSGQREIFVQSVPAEVAGSVKTGGRFQITTGGGGQPVWRADGKEVFYIAPDGRMMAVPVESGADYFRRGEAKALFETRVTGTGRAQYDVTPDGQRFLIAQQVDDPGETPITILVNWRKLITK